MKDVARRWTSRISGVVAVCTTAMAIAPLLFAAPSASEKATAESDFEEGRKLMTAGKPNEACPKFEESQKLDPAMATEYRLGECYEAVGKTASAWLAFIDVADEADAAKMPDRSKVARERAAKLQPKLARLAISPSTPEIAELHVVRDGEELKRTLWGTPVPVDPGDHNIEVTSPGKKPWRTTVHTDPSVTQTVTVPALEDLGATSSPTITTVTSAAPTTTPTATTTSTAPDTFDRPPPDKTKDTASSGGSSQRTYAIVAGAVGAVGIIAGSVVALSAKSQYNDSSAHCNAADICDQAGVDARSGAKSKGNLASLLWGVGIVGLAAGTVLWFTAPPSEESKTASSVRVGVTPFGALVEGHF